jgi:glycosyltransferase involved in cell wall biosynthesis
VSAEARTPANGPASALDARWRAESERLQEQALPDGRVVVSCPAPYGIGGLGRHLKEIVQALERKGQPAAVICDSSDAENPRQARRAPGVADLTGLLAPLVRYSPAWRMWTASVRFDADAARRLPPAEELIAFNGTALAQFRAARRAQLKSISLMSANSHMRRVIRQHDLAYRQYPLERPWATHLLRRNLGEYAQADRIYVASRYIRDSFAEEGFAEEAISYFPLTPDPRFRPDGSSRDADTFDIVYSGSLIVHKGVPLLVDAFRRLAQADMRLVLVGGWKTPSMRRFIERTRSEDPRVVVSPGDPLPHLRRARLCVHPAYEDGFGYAPAEALACGVPVIVSEDTGMKELIEDDRHGLIIPTGDVGALAQAIEAAYRGEILGG